MKILLIIIIALLSRPGFALENRVFGDLEKQTRSGHSERIEFWSQYFLGSPYDPSGPLGEGPDGLYDQDPQYRFDAFDCTTFVETVISLARSWDKDSFIRNMNQVRYLNGEVSYVYRNHITSQAWAPRNIENGLLTDVTTHFAGHLQQRGSALIDYPNWLSSRNEQSLRLPEADRGLRNERLERLRSFAEQFSSETVEIDYLSIEGLLNDWELFKRDVAQPMVVNIVRPNWNLRALIGTNLHISHQGILIKERSRLVFIHASSAGSVLKIDLRAYLEKIQKTETIKGINLMRLEP